MSSGCSIQRIASLQDAADTWQQLSGNALESDPDFFETMLVAIDGDRPVGCLSLYDNPYVQKEGEKTLVFGNLHLPDSSGVCKQLIASGVEYALTHGHKNLLGPMNGNTWNNYRLPLDNFGQQFLTDLPHPAHYSKFLFDTGFTVCEEYYTFLSGLYPGVVDQALLHQLREQNITIRSINLENYEAELEKIFCFCQQVFVNNVYFSPVSKEGFISKYVAVRPFIDPEFVTVAENAEGVLKAIYFVLPDIISKNRLVIKTIARAPGKDLKGIMTVMSQQLYNKASEKGYQDIVHAFMHSSNPSVKLSERFSGRPFKSYGLFSKQVHG